MPTSAQMTGKESEKANEKGAGLKMGERRVERHKPSYVQANGMDNEDLEVVLPERNADYQTAAEDIMRQNREAYYGSSFRSSCVRNKTGRTRVYLGLRGAPCLGPCPFTCGGWHGGSRSRRTKRTFTTDYFVATWLKCGCIQCIAAVRISCRCDLVDACLNVAPCSDPCHLACGRLHGGSFDQGTCRMSQTFRASDGHVLFSMCSAKIFLQTKGKGPKDKRSQEDRAGVHYDGLRATQELQNKGPVQGERKDMGS